MGWHPTIPYYVPGLGHQQQEAPGQKKF